MSRSNVGKTNENMKYYILNGILFIIMLNMFHPFLVTYLKVLGGDEYHISLMNSLPGLVAIFTIIPGTIFINRCNNKQAVTGLFIGLSRSFILLYALIPFFPIEIQPLLLAIIVGVRNIPESLAMSSAQSFTADIFSPMERSTAISNNKRYGMPIQIIVAFITGNIMSKLPQTRQEEINIYQIFFVIAFVVGLIEIYTFMKLKPININKKTKKIVRPKELLNLKENKSFWIFLLCSFLFHFGWQMGWPLFSIYQVEYLKADELWISIFFSSAAIVSFFTYRFWNNKIIQYGNTKIAFIVTLGMSFNAIAVAISPNLYVMTILSTISGVFTSGTVTVLLNLLLEVTPEDNRVLYVGVYNTALNISLFISPFVGYFILEKTTIFIALITVAVIRAIGGLTFYLRYHSLEKRKTV